MYCLKTLKIHQWAALHWVTCTLSYSEHWHGSVLSPSYVHWFTAPSWCRKCTLEHQMCAILLMKIVPEKCTLYCCLLLFSATLSPVAQRMYPAMAKKRRMILLHFPQAPHTPAPELNTALFCLTAQLLVASHQRGPTSFQLLLLSGVWKKSAGLSLHFKVGGQWLDKGSFRICKCKCLVCPVLSTNSIFLSFCYVQVVRSWLPSFCHRK